MPLKSFPLKQGLFGNFSLIPKFCPGPNLPRGHSITTGSWQIVPKLGPVKNPSSPLNAEVLCTPLPSKQAEAATIKQECLQFCSGILPFSILHHPTKNFNIMSTSQFCPKDKLSDYFGPQLKIGQTPWRRWTLPHFKRRDRGKI